MTTMGHLSVCRWKDVLLGACLFCNFDICRIFLPFCFVYLSLCFPTSYQRLLMTPNVKWSQFSISDRMPPSSFAKAAVCSAASAMTYQQTYFRWLVLLTVIQWQEKNTHLLKDFLFFSHLLHRICREQRHVYTPMIQMQNKKIICRKICDKSFLSQTTRNGIISFPYFLKSIFCLVFLSLLTMQWAPFDRKMDQLN